MHRRLVIAAALFVIGGASASAQPQPAPEPEAARTTSDVPVEPGAQTSRQLLGANLGLEAGGEVTPGGLRLGGSYIYRLTDEDWLDSSVGFTFGSGDPRCFRDRQNDVVCDHGIASGFSAEAAFAIRRDFALRDRFRPFARVGLALRLIGFGNDEVIGVGLPVLASGGVRARVHPAVSVVSMVDVRVGWSIFNRGLGAEAHASFALSAGVEFDID